MKYLATSLSLALSCQVAYSWAPAALSYIRQRTTHLKQSTIYAEKNDYNVVFRPNTSNEDSFDSLKLGTARVHRYADPSSGLDDSEYM